MDEGYFRRIGKEYEGERLICRSWWKLKRKEKNVEMEIM